MDVVKIIIDSITDRDKLKTNTIGNKLYEVAKQVEQQRKIEKVVEKKQELTEAEQKVIALRGCEASGDLGWMDYSSWNIFNPAFKKQFCDAVDPLFWSGLYFQYSRFEKAFPALFQFLTLDCSISVLRDGKNSQLVATGMDDYMISKKKVMEFENYQRAFHTKIYKAFGRVGNEPIIREYKNGVLCPK